MSTKPPTSTPWCITGPRGEPLLYWPAVASAAGCALLALAVLVALVRTGDRPPRSGVGFPRTLVFSADRPASAGTLPADEVVPQPFRPGDLPAAPAPRTGEDAPAPERPTGAAPGAPSEGGCAGAACSASKEQTGSQRWGTAVDFVASAAAADEQSRAARKLRFVLHLSGHLEDTSFT